VLQDENLFTRILIIIFQHSEDQAILNALLMNNEGALEIAEKKRAELIIYFDSQVGI
jgi:hypothetical protein